MNKLFFKRHASTILTCLGSVGVVATAVAAAKATPKAMLLLNYAECEKNDELTFMEKVRVAGPAYIPAILIGASTLACIFGANILNKRQQAAITSAYALLDNTYKEYKAKTRELLGGEGEKQLVESVIKDEYNEEEVIQNRGRGTLFFDFYSLQLFRSTHENVKKAEDYVNFALRQRGYALLSEFYDILGIPCGDVDSSLCWSSLNNIRFSHQEMNADGEECWVIHMLDEPTLCY